MSWIIIVRVKRDGLAFPMMEGVKDDDLHIKEWATAVDAEGAVASFERTDVEDGDETIIDYQLFELKI